MLEVACYAITLTAAAWAVWVRRTTFRNPLERSTMYAIIQLALAPVLIAPVSMPILGWVDWAACKLTGHGHLEDYVGTTATITAVTAHVNQAHFAT
jgi:hypothetical protein